MAADDAQHRGRVADVLGEGPDLVERRRERNQSITGDTSVRGLEPHTAAEGGGLANGSAGVGAEGGNAFVGGNGSRRSTGGTARDARGVPRILGGEIRRILGGTAHRKFV